MTDGADISVVTGETVGSKPTPSPPASRRPRGRRLGSIANVKAALADLYRALEDGKVETGKARAMVYALSVLLGALQGMDLEQRIRALEARGDG